MQKENIAPTLSSSRVTKISIIMPVYNGEKFLKDSLESVLNQTFTDFEFIIVNDGSKDNSLNIIKEYANRDNRIKIIDQENKGLAAALNIGVETSKSVILSIIEHDDIWLTHKLEKIFDLAKKNKEIITHNAIEYNLHYKKFTKINKGNFSCLTISKNISKILFPLPEENKKYLGIEDGIIAAEIALNKKEIKDKIIHLNEVLTIMKIGEDTLSGKKDNLKIKKRYKNVLIRYLYLKGNSKDLDKLLTFWKRHYIYNKLMTYMPEKIKLIIYFLVDKIKKRKMSKDLDIKYSHLRKYVKNYY